MTKIIKRLENNNSKVSCGWSKDDNGMTFTGNINLVIQYEKHYYLLLSFYPDKEDFSKSFLMELFLPLKRVANEIDSSKFHESIALTTIKTDNDPQGQNFGKFLSNTFKLNCQDGSFKRVDLKLLDSKTSNYLPNKLETTQMSLTCTDAKDFEIFNLVVNWPEKRVVLSIKNENTVNFETIFFVTKEIYKSFIEKIKSSQNIIKTVDIIGFDISGEPSINVYDTGVISIQFSFMPPLNGKDDPSDLAVFEYFEKELERKINTHVIRDDREQFYIPNPKDDTLDRLIKYLQEFWSHDKIKVSSSYNNDKKRSEENPKSTIALLLRLIRFFIR